MKILKPFYCFALIVALLCTGIFNVSAKNNDLSNRIEDSIEYIKSNYENDFSSSDPALALKADMWSLLCAVSAQKLDDPEYKFLIPQVDVDNLSGDVSVTDLAKATISIKLLGKDPNSFQGQNVTGDLASKQLDDGSFGDDLNANDFAFAIIALEVSGGKYDSQKAVDSLVKLQKIDGGYTYDNNMNLGNVDTTGMVLAALSLNRYGKSKSKSAIDYLYNTIDSEGFFVGKGEWDSANSCSQSMALIGLSMVGENLSSERWDGVADALYSLQTDEGGFLYTMDSENPDYYSTHQSLAALGVMSYVSDNNINQNVESNNAHGIPETGDDGINPFIIVLVVAGVLAIVVCLLLPKFKKK